jgi:hypothetical protein
MLLSTQVGLKRDEIILLSTQVERLRIVGRRAVLFAHATCKC